MNINRSLFLWNFGEMDRMAALAIIFFQILRSPLEGAIYATAGGVFTLVLLIAQVMSISSFGHQPVW